MSFFASVKAAAASAVDKTKAGIAHLQAPPTEIQCSFCPLKVAVPPTAWDWKCVDGHSNERTATECKECKKVKPSSLPSPQVICTRCGSSTLVPSNNAAALAKNAAVQTQAAASSAATAVKAQYNHLTSAPTQFHCAHCDALLAVPTGPWACQTCHETNAEDIPKCGKCAQPKADQKAICGVCKQSTKIPTTNFANSLSHGVRDIHKSSKKVYYDVSSKPYITCPKCQTHILIPKPAAAAAAAAPTSEEGKASQYQVPTEGVPGGAPATDSAPTPAGTTQAAPSDKPAPDVVVPKDLKCPSCNNLVQEE